MRTILQSAESSVVALTYLLLINIGLIAGQQFEPAPYINATFTNSTGVSLNIWTKNGTRNNTAPYLPGILFEDIAQSGDGGIYAELIRNRAFQGSGISTGFGAPLLPGIIVTSSENPILPFAPVLDGWYPIGDAQLRLDLLHPLSDALQVALQVSIPLNASGEVGFKNDGWWGMDVSPQTYNASFYCQANGFRWNNTLTHFNISLRDNLTNEVFVESTIPLSKSNAPVPWMYQHYISQLKNTLKAPSINNSFTVTMDAAEARGQTFYFDLISLFPETYKNRPNGLRKDLAKKLQAGAFRFLRFPGGNNLEGYSIARRWKWWETIGPLKDRKGRPGDWTYYNTDGLGLMEFMYWCEDMDLVPVLAVYAGFSLDIADYDGTNSTDSNELPIGMMGPILQEALDELEFLTGNTFTYWGAKRAEYGHPEPFDVPFVEIGNEDFFSHNYPARAAFMHEGLKARYPNITYIYTAANLYPQELGNFNITLPQGVIWDDHLYQPPSYFIEGFNQFDKWQEVTNNPGVDVAVMEYHVSSIDDVTSDPTFNISNTAITNPRMLNAVAEAVYALGWERNPDLVKLECFAPAIQRIEAWRETPYLLLFDSDPCRTVLSTSYYQEQMFNLHHGTQTLPVTIGQGDFNPLFWQASIDVPRNEIYFKMVNAGNTSQTLVLKLDTTYGFVNGTTLHAPDPTDLNAFNGWHDDHVIIPQAIADLDNFGSQSDNGSRALHWQVPPYSVNVLQFNLVGANSTNHDSLRLQKLRRL